jgi:hypothetical protein
MMPGDWYEVEHGGTWLPVAFFVPIPGQDLSGQLALTVIALALVDGRFQACPGKLRERGFRSRLRDINENTPD